MEFQKRGHPHVHMLITLAEEDKIVGADMVDRIVSAEIPNPDTHPRLHGIVTRCMLHGPCGNGFASRTCTKNNGICDKRFPKNFSEETICATDQYPIYRRRNNGRQYTKRCRQENGPNVEFTFDNTNVVPYNAQLSLKYDTHINVEVCSSIKCIKYLYKYVYKGHDRARICVDEDEIKQYLDCRYVSAQEATYRLFQFPMQGRSHTVYRLHIHLPGQHAVFFEDGQEEQSVNREPHSKLLEWFKLNSRDEVARTLLYTEVGNHFVWKNRRWVERQVKY